MAKYALIDTRDNTVANVIVWDGVTPYTPPPYHVTRLVRAGEVVGPGFTYDPQTDTFVAPPEPAAAGRTLPRDAFVGRLGLAHLAQIVAAAQSDPALGALIVRVQTAGELIDLDAPDVVAGLALLVARGILTAAEAAEVSA